MTKCEKCGHEIAIGDFPFCPHEPTGGVLHMGEEPMEAYYDENLTSEPGGVEITTRGQRRKIMEENHFEYRKKTPHLGAVMYFDQGAK